MDVATVDMSAKSRHEAFSLLLSWYKIIRCDEEDVTPRWSVSSSVLKQRDPDL